MTRIKMIIISYMFLMSFTVRCFTVSTGGTFRQKMNIFSHRFIKLYPFCMKQKPKWSKNHIQSWLMSSRALCWNRHHCCGFNYTLADRWRWTWPKTKWHTILIFDTLVDIQKKKKWLILGDVTFGWISVFCKLIF